MPEEKLQEALAHAQEAKQKAVEAYNFAERIETDIKHQMELEHLRLSTKVDTVYDDVKVHRNILVFIGSAIGLGVIGALMKVIGL